MRYVLNLADDGRVLSVASEDSALVGAVIVDSLPEGDTTDYLYVEGEFIHEPLPVEEVVEIPTRLDKVEAQVAYLAMMTGYDEILEV